jgi:hypothetical protein
MAVVRRKPSATAPNACQSRTAPQFYWVFVLSFPQLRLEGGGRSGERWAFRVRCGAVKARCHGSSGSLKTRAGGSVTPM